MNDNIKLKLKRLIIVIVIILGTLLVINTNFKAKPITKQTQLELEIISEVNNQ